MIYFGKLFPDPFIYCQNFLLMIYLSCPCSSLGCWRDWGNERAFVPIKLSLAVRPRLLLIR